MATASGFTFITGTTPSTPSAGKTKLYVDSTTGPSYVDDAGVVHALKGDIGITGETGNSLTRPLNASLTSSSGTATVNLSSGNEVYRITLTENTTIVFSNLPASGYVAEVRVRITQHASSAKTCAFSGTSVKYAGGVSWSASAVLSSVEDVGVAVDSSGNLTVYPSGALG